MLPCVGESNFCSCRNGGIHTSPDLGRVFVLTGLSDPTGAASILLPSDPIPVEFRGVFPPRT